MSDKNDTAARYRKHAEKLRVIAVSDRHMFTRDVLLRAASDCERMAAIARMRSNHSPPPIDALPLAQVFANRAQQVCPSGTWSQSFK